MKRSSFFLVACGVLLFASRGYSDNGSCCLECICPSSGGGVSGAQGFAGEQGGVGEEGSVGIQGELGPQGPRGIQGITGPKGPCCSNARSGANVFSVIDQLIAPQSPVLFQYENAVTAADYDMSLLSATGEIIFLKSGTFQVSWTVEGLLTTPFPFPVPVWSFSLYLDGVPIPGSCFSAFTLFPNARTTSARGSVIISITAGQVLVLKNSSILPVNIVSSVPGSLLPETSASIVIEERS